MLKTIIVFIVIINWLIHLMGFTKAFKLEEIYASIHEQVMFIGAIPGSLKVTCWLVSIN